MYNKPTIISAQQYETKVTIEKDSSEITLTELMEIFENIAMCLGYHPSSWKNLILEMADEIKEDDKGN